MTEYWASCKCGRLIEEASRPWNSITEKILRIGLKLNGNCVCDLEVPEDYKGLIQCKYATIIGGITTTNLHIIGYVDRDRKNQVKVYDYNIGTEIAFNTEQLNLGAHTVWRN